MLGSYLAYTSECQEAGLVMPWLHGLLWDLVHRGRVTFLGLAAEKVDPPVAAPSRPCMAPNCARCQEGRGGYQFRWYSAAWATNYNRTGRPGSWMAPELHAGQHFLVH